MDGLGTKYLESGTGARCARVVGPPLNLALLVSDSSYVLQLVTDL